MLTTQLGLEPDLIIRNSEYPAITRQFFEDIQNHSPNILLPVANQQLKEAYTHTQYRHPDHLIASYEILTTPTHLFVTGDMGEYTFKTPAPLLFFNQSRVNYPYWAEKCTATGNMDSIMILTRESVKQTVEAEINLLLTESPHLSPVSATETLNLIMEEFDSYDNEPLEWLEWFSDSRNAPRQWEGLFHTDRLLEDFHQYHPRFIWILHAIWLSTKHLHTLRK